MQWKKIKNPPKETVELDSKVSENEVKGVGFYIPICI